MLFKTFSVFIFFFLFGHSNQILLENASHIIVTYTTISDGNWTASSTWLGGVVPGNDLNGDIVNINHRVNYNNSNDLEISNGALNINHILDVNGRNIKMENSSGSINLDTGLLLIDNANLELKDGSINLSASAIQICNGSFVDESSGGTNGDGYIFNGSGDIEDKNPGNFSLDIAWCSYGSGSGLPTAENCAVAEPPGGCGDETFFLTLSPSTECKKFYINPHIGKRIKN